jgi:acetylornithine/succinyldiaminopimelate/putrescine aminotransferase
VGAAAAWSGTRTSSIWARNSPPPSTPRICGSGRSWGIQPENAAPELLTQLCWEKGLYIRSSTMETVCIAPALIMEKTVIDRIVETLDQAIPEMEEKLLR